MVTSKNDKSTAPMIIQLKFYSQTETENQRCIKIFKFSNSTIKNPIKFIQTLFLFCTCKINFSNSEHQVIRHNKVQLLGVGNK